MLRACLIAVFGVMAAQGAITNVRITSTSATQAVLRFLAPDLTFCTIEVSESAAHTPLVNDVNSSLFADANKDSRDPSLQRGRERVFVLGKRTIERDTSGIARSRALQTATLHFYRLTCGADTATGSFSTKPTPMGDTRGDPPIPDPDYVGRSLSISPNFTRNATWIDPHSGVLHKRVQQPQDNNLFNTFNDNLFASVLESTNWTTPNNVLSITDAGASATYDGVSCGATCDWLKLTYAYAPTTSYEYRLDVIRISANGSGSDASSANRTIEICPVIAATTTIDPGGACRDLVLPQTTPAKVTLAATGIQDTWRLPGKRELNYVEQSIAGSIRFAARKKTSTGTISLDAIRIDIWQSTTGLIGSSGSYDRCSTILRADSTYLCASFNATTANNLYSIHSETGDATFLGAIYSTGNFSISQDNFLWDATDPNVFYGQGSGDTQQFKYTYTGAGTEVAAGTKVTLTRSALTPGGEDVGPAIQTYVTANAASYPGLTFSSAAFNCPFDSVVGTDYLSILCRGQQDTYGWQAVYKISTNSIVAAMPSFAAPACRWCVFHTRQPAGTTPALLVDLTFAKDSYAGNQIYKSTLVGNLSSTSAGVTVTVTSTCGGDATCVSWVEGEPVATIGDDYLQAVQTGDVAVIDSEYVRITKNSPTSWTLSERGLFGSTAATHTNGTQFRMFCANKPGAGPTNYFASPFLVWNFLGDPTGLDSTGTYVWPNQYTGHASGRLNVFVGNKSVAQSAEGTFVLTAIKDPPYDRNPPEVPWFAGKQPPGQGNCYQQHPNYGQVSAPLYDRQFFFDIRPFVGGNCFSKQTVGCTITNDVYPASGGCSAGRVSGLTNVYRVTVADADDNPDGLNPKHLATIGNSGSKLLRDVSGPASSLDDSAAKDYTFCTAIVANECVTGSLAGQHYVQIPSLAVPYCDGSNTTVDACLGDYYAQGVALSRYGFLRNKEGLSTSLLANANAVGSAYIQRLSMHGLNLFYNAVSLFTTGKPLANGKWALAADWVETPSGRGLLTVLKIPPAVKDDVNRSTWVPFDVAISPMRGADGARVKFGYAENGASTAFYCTSRADVCYANAASINATNPFYWSVETPAPLSCASGCTIRIPAISGRALYYSIEYLSSSTVVHTGPLQVEQLQ